MPFVSHSFAREKSRPLPRGAGGGGWVMWARLRGRRPTASASPRLCGALLPPVKPSNSAATAEWAANATTYTWDHKRLLFGQPVRLDVLGIAPIDRLGELTQLAPVTVISFRPAGRADRPHRALARHQ
jgi:hypothetical protein